MGARLIETQVISKDQWTFAKLLHFKTCTECVCVNIPQLKYPGTE